MEAACVYLILALYSKENEGRLAATFSSNVNIICKMYLKIETSLHGTMKKIWFYKFLDLLPYPLKTCGNNQAERLTSAIVNFRDLNQNEMKTDC